MDAALKDNHRLKRKASKAKEVVDDLRTNLKGARIDVRHCKSVINTRSQLITSRVVVMHIQIGRSASALERGTCHPSAY